MTEIYANIRLRPTRIGFLVRPNDMKSICKIMQINTCLWGGSYNPIIPVYRVPPKEWRAPPHERTRGIAVAKGYINFFEPDVYVEAQKGLLEEVGLEKLRQEYTSEPHILPLNKFLKIEENRDYSEPAMGLNVTDVFRHLYKTEQRFEHRDKRQSIIVKPVNNSGLVEAIFGSYPTQRHASYIKNGYKDVFIPEEIEATPEGWLKVFQDNARSPLRVTDCGLDFQQYWYHDPTIYIFDPTRSTDLIDLWNMRLEPYPILPVPVEWIEKLSEFLRSVLKQEHRPVIGNPNGIMHRCTIEFGRSISKERADEAVKPLTIKMPKGSICIKYWRNRIWGPQDNDFVQGPELLKITASEEQKNLSVIEEKKNITSRFEALYPEFASRYGGHGMRWINAVQVSAHGPKKVATVLPYNTYNREWPRLRLIGERVIVGREGWIFGQYFKKSDEALNLLTKEDAIIGTLQQLGIKARLSDPGHIAKQVLDHLGGLWGVTHLANKETVKLLNKMAGSVRRRKNEEDSLEEHFEGRTATVKKWNDLITNNSKNNSLRASKLEDYTERNLIRLGLETVCPHCQGKNWHGLDAVNYSTLCERCLNSYEFPQADHTGRNWKYRVIGPFSIPDYARGSYSALLTLRAMDTLGGGHRGEMTFTTALDLEFEDVKCEADFVALRRKDKMGEYLPPELIIGECKSFGNGNLIKPKDLSKLRQLAKKLPDAIIVLAVMRDQFTESELKIIKPFVEWARRSNDRGRATNPVILFTGHELFVDHLISATWKELGKPYEDYTDYNHTRDLYSLAQATQAIHLDLPSVYEGRVAKHKKKSAKKSSKKKK